MVEKAVNIPTRKKPEEKLVKNARLLVMDEFSDESSDERGTHSSIYIGEYKENYDGNAGFNTPSPSVSSIVEDMEVSVHSSKDELLQRTTLSDEENSFNDVKKKLVDNVWR